MKRGAGEIARISEVLQNAQETRTPCDPITEGWEDFTVEDAYAVQLHGMHVRRESGARRVGHKIGITSEAVMRWLRVDQPDFGTLVDDMAVPDGGQADFNVLLQPRVEGEIAFVLKHDLRGPGLTAGQVLAAVDFILPCIEIIDSRIRDWQLKAQDTIADNASCGLFVLGSRPLAPSAIDLHLAGMTLRRNGEVASTGAGAACLGHPVNAVVWLANKLGSLNVTLEAGEVILSGALGPVVPVDLGDFVEVEVSGLGRVSVRF